MPIVLHERLKVLRVISVLTLFNVIATAALLQALL